MNTRTQVFALLALLIVSTSCRKTKKGGSKLMVLNGVPVTKAAEGAGTYAVIFKKRNPDNTYTTTGNASTVATGTNVFITNAHVINQMKSSDQVIVQDYQGNTVTSFKPTEKKVQLMAHDKFNNGAENDIGAVILPQSLPPAKLTHGVAPIAVSQPKVGDTVRLVGAGLGSLENNGINRDGTPAQGGAGVLRYGENKISEISNGQQWVDAPTFIDPSKKSETLSTSLPGDSGGGAFTFDKSGVPQFSGITSGGWLSDSQGNRYRTGQPGYIVPMGDDGKAGKPIAVSEAEKLGLKSSSYTTDLSQQNQFLEKVSQAGGNIGIPTYYDPKTRNQVTPEQVDSYNKADNGWSSSAIVRSSDESVFAYRGEQSGEYRREAEGDYRWYDQAGNKTDATTQFNSATNSWQNNGVKVDYAGSSTPVINQGPPDTMGSSQPQVITQGPPSTVSQPVVETQGPPDTVSSSSTPSFSAPPVINTPPPETVSTQPTNSGGGMPTTYTPGDATR